MVTGGGYNTEYLVSHAFLEEAQQKLRPHRVWHVLPEREQEVRVIRSLISIARNNRKNKTQSKSVLSFNNLRKRLKQDS